MSMKVKLFKACENGDVVQVKVLVSQGAHLDATNASHFNYTPLHYAAVWVASCCVNLYNEYNCPKRTGQMQLG